MKPILGLPRKRPSSPANPSGIHIAPENKGKLHASLHVPPGQKIPVQALEAAKQSGNPTEEKRANFALNARKWAH